MNLKTKLCNDLIENNMVKEFDVIRHSYSNSRIEEWEDRGVEANNMSPCITTRADTLGAVVKDKIPCEVRSDEGIRFFKDDLCGTLRTKDSGGDKRIIETNAPTLTATSADEKIVNGSLRIRKLTPLECWRLMGFDDEDFYKAKEVCSDSQLYKQAGNSIVVNVLEAIFKELF